MFSRFLFIFLFGLVLLGVSCQRQCPNGNENSGVADTPPAQGTSKVVFVLLDISDSTEAAATREKYAQTFRAIVERVADGDVLVADAITDNPLSQSSFPVNETFPVFDPKTDNPLVVKKRRQEFETELETVRKRVGDSIGPLLSERSRPILRTKILDATHLAERVFKTYEKPRKILVVFSDMVEESERYNFKTKSPTDSETQRIIEAERKAGRVPDLNGVRVHVIGSAIEGRGASEAFQRIQSFWIEYFKAAGAELSKERYGASLLRFDE